MGYGKQSRVRDILSDPAALSVAEKYIPTLTWSPVLAHMGFLPFSAVLHVEGAALSPDEAQALWDELERLPGTPRADADAPYLEPARDYEPESVPRGSARAALAGPSEQWGVTELVIDGPSHGNPFVDVEVAARFTDDRGQDITVGGFYDGDGVYRVRFCAPQAGSWQYITT